MDEALAVCRAGSAEHPDLEELLFLEAALLHGRGDQAGAEGRLLRLLRTPAGRPLAAGDAGRRSYKARHLLAEVYRCQGRPAEAEAQWRLVVAEEPRFAPAWKGLGELYLAQGRWAELDEVIRSLERADEPEAVAFEGAGDPGPRESRRGLTRPQLPRSGRAARRRYPPSRPGRGIFGKNPERIIWKSGQDLRRGIEPILRIGAFKKLRS